MRRGQINGLYLRVGEHLVHGLEHPTSKGVRGGLGPLGEEVRYSDKARVVRFQDVVRDRSVCDASGAYDSSSYCHIWLLMFEIDQCLFR